ncbi:MAG: hypothetical protein K0S47_2123 [Herbinix sp.]|nr:hypothetical protein [Herbinix sp.]
MIEKVERKLINKKLTYVTVQFEDTRGPKYGGIKRMGVEFS